MLHKTINGRLLPRNISTGVCQATGGSTSNLDVTNINNGDWIAVGNADLGTKGAKTFTANSTLS